MTKTLEQIPVRLVRSDTDAADEPRTCEFIVAGWLVAPGLAVHRSWDHGAPTDGRYSLTHLASASHLVSDLCARHIDQAVAAAIATGIDWTLDREEIVDDPHRARLLAGVDAGDWCGQDESCRAEPYPRPCE
ncbi:hypothetical protein [Micromonospora sp. NPDC049662]|uniref:hypothetical protein n=1 Tax=Micromonospora sp. NPDC049662 TaxID=3155397 RepID=UPI00344A47A0